MNAVDIVTALEAGKTIMVARQGTEDWKKMEVSKTGFALDFKKFKYKVSE